MTNKSVPKIMTSGEACPSFIILEMQFGVCFKFCIWNKKHFINAFAYLFQISVLWLCASCLEGQCRNTLSKEYNLIPQQKTKPSKTLEC